MKEYTVEHVLALDLYFSKQNLPDQWTREVDGIIFSRSKIDTTIQKLFAAVQIKGSSDTNLLEFNALWTLFMDNSRSLLDGTPLVWTVSPNEDPDSKAVAAFSDANTAYKLSGKLNTYVIGGARVNAISADENNLEVDKFKEHVELGLLPYWVELNRDGSLFDSMDLLGELEEPTFFSLVEHVKNMLDEERKDPNKHWGISGTFWASDSLLALKKARLLRSMLFKSLNVSLNRPLIRRETEIKKYTYSQIVELQTWYELNYIPSSVGNRNPEFVYLPYQARENLDGMLKAAKETGESSVGYDVYTQLQLMKTLFNSKLDDSNSYYLFESAEIPYWSDPAFYKITSDYTLPNGIKIYRGEFGLGERTGDIGALHEFIMKARKRDLRSSFKQSATSWET